MPPSANTILKQGHESIAYRLHVVCFGVIFIIYLPKVWRALKVFFFCISADPPPLPSPLITKRTRTLILTMYCLLPTVFFHLENGGWTVWGSHQNRAPFFVLYKFYLTVSQRAGRRRRFILTRSSNWWIWGGWGLYSWKNVVNADEVLGREQWDLCPSGLSAVAWRNWGPQHLRDGLKWLSLMARFYVA